MTQGMDASSGPGSREPDPQAVPALPGFDPSRFLELVARCEALGTKGVKAEQAALKLNGDIALALGAAVAGYKRGGPWAKDRWFSRGGSLAFQAPAYTTSFDAALRLAQPNWWFNASAPLSPDAYGYSREDMRQPRAGFEMIGHPYSAGARAATIPLAICAAALRARAASAIEARRAATGTGAVHESAVPLAADATTPSEEPTL